MWRRRFRDEQSEWRCEDSPRWLKEFERLGPEKVRQYLAPYARQGPRAAVPIGNVNDVTKGYVSDWLAWKDSHKIDWGMWSFVLSLMVLAGGWVIAKWSAIVSFIGDLAVSLAG